MLPPKKIDKEKSTDSCQAKRAERIYKRFFQALTALKSFHFL